MLQTRAYKFELSSMMLFTYIGIIYTLIFEHGPVIFFLATSLILAFLLILRIDDPILRNIILVALILRVILAIIQAYTSINLPGAGVDSVTFEKHGWQNAQAWLYGSELGRTTKAYYFSSWIGLLYIFFGREPFIPQLFNIYFSLFAIYYVYHVCYLSCDSKRVARLGALIFMLVPSLNAFASILLRETMIILLVIVAYYYFLLWLKEERLIYFGVTFLAMTLAGALHGVVFFLMGVYLFFFAFYKPREQRFRLTVVQILAAAFFVVLASVLLGTVINHQLPATLADIVTPDHIRGVLERKPVGRTTIMPGILPYSYLDLLWQTPLRVVHFLFAPFPWALETKRDIYGIFDVILYIGLIYYAFSGGKKLYHSSKAIVISIILLLASMLIMFAWGTANYGTAWRHRQKLAPFIIVTAAAGISYSKRWNWLLPDSENATSENQMIGIVDI